MESLDRRVSPQNRCFHIEKMCEFIVTPRTRTSVSGTVLIELVTINTKPPGKTEASYSCLLSRELWPRQ